MDFNAQREISRHLDSGEQLLWAGIPKQGLLLRSSDAFLIPFSLFWGGFALFWEKSALEAPNAPPLFPLFGIPFVLIGLYLIVGRFFVDSRMRANTFYGLTNRRVIIQSGVVSRTINSLPIQGLDEVSLLERADRTGTIMFGRPHPYASWQSGLLWPGMGQYRTPMFESIDDARRVHDQVLAAQRATV